MDVGAAGWKLASQTRQSRPAERRSPCLNGSKAMKINLKRWLTAALLMLGLAAGGYYAWQRA